ncbi:serine/threonine-protein phosphatase 7 long form homolog [Abrus precatorius]|uniref:Serine/threonine-protein phosphatase 7 long form homolog n=1 Tax=Abrus precatorius TaxID=3816 RepID=A0A8B8LGG5_ABRPR|nr:serine/threonine-protein phosphatase 7 long form homolog [Abrus precatorius]
MTKGLGKVKNTYYKRKLNMNLPGNEDGNKEMTSSSSQSRVLNPGPEDGSLLRFQYVHVSEHIWDGREHPILKVRQSHFIPAGMEGVLMEILPHLTLAGFAGVAQLACFPIDLHLITALVERWRPETHTFHMPPGECTITLQNIAIQIRLRIDGCKKMYKF